MAESPRGRDADGRRREEYDRNGERDRVRVHRNTSRDRVRSPAASTRHGLEREPRPETSTFPSSSHKHGRASSVSQDRPRARERSRRRSPSRSSRRDVREDESYYRPSRRREPSGDRTSQTSRRRHASPPHHTTHRRSITPSSDRYAHRYAKRKRDSSRERTDYRETARRQPERTYSPRPPRDDRTDRRISPDPYISHNRRRSRSNDSRYRPEFSRRTRRPSPEDRARAREGHQGRYYSPERRERRRHTPSPRGGRSYKGERDLLDRPSRREEDYQRGRDAKAGRRSPAIQRKSSASPPDDLISALAGSNRREGSRIPEGPAADRRRRSPRPRSPPPTSQSRRHSREDPRYRDSRYDSSRDDRRGRSPQRGRDRGDRRPDPTSSEMYGRGGPPRGPQRPYVDPRYSQSPQHYYSGHATPHGQSPYHRGGYQPQQQMYASHHG